MPEPTRLERTGRSASRAHRYRRAELTLRRLDGAGPQLTQITCECQGGVFTFDGGIVSSVSDLSVIGSWSAIPVSGLLVQGGSNVRADDLEITVSGVGDFSTAAGVSVQGAPTVASNLELTDVSIDASASGTGSQAAGVAVGDRSNVTVESSDVSASASSATGGAIDVVGADTVVHINGSLISGGADNALQIAGDNTGDPEVVFVTGGAVDGSVSASSGGQLRCALTFDGLAVREFDCPAEP